jgi:opine dehydrogenase
VRVAVLGGGAGGHAVAVRLALDGHPVSFWSRSPATVASILTRGGIAYTGIWGDGTMAIDRASTILEAAVAGTDLVVVCLPAFAHASVAAALAGLKVSAPIVLNPGHPGGALEARRVMVDLGVSVPPLVELSTLSVWAKFAEGGEIRILSSPRAVRAACLHGSEHALAMTQQALTNIVAEPNVLVTSLASVNIIVHPPQAVLGAALVEGSRSFTMYDEAITPSIERVMHALDNERLGVARAFGIGLPSIAEEMARLGNADARAAHRGEIRNALAAIAIMAEARGPTSTDHRYYHEDFDFGLTPLVALGDIADVATPVAESLSCLREALIGARPERAVRNASAMGLETSTKHDLLELMEEARARPS